MDPAALLESYGLYAGTFVVCLFSGVIPLINAELFLIGIVALVPGGPSLLPLVAIATAGQMTAKIAMYWAGRGVLGLPLGKYRKILEKWQDKFAQSEPRLSLFIFASAFTGLPPFFAISVLAGTFRVPFARFMVVGYAGRFLRFGLCAGFPAVMKSLF